MATTKIRKEDRGEIEKQLHAWTKANKASVRVEGETFFIAKSAKAGGGELEVVVENGWAYLHGRGTAMGKSTNIESMEEFGEAASRLLG